MRDIVIATIKQYQKRMEDMLEPQESFSDEELDTFEDARLVQHLIMLVVLETR